MSGQMLHLRADVSEYAMKQEDTSNESLWAC